MKEKTKHWPYSGDDDGVLVLCHAIIGISIISLFSYIHNHYRRYEYADAYYVYVYLCCCCHQRNHNLMIYVCSSLYYKLHTVKGSPAAYTFQPGSTVFASLLGWMGVTLRF